MAQQRKRTRRNAPARQTGRQPRRRRTSTLAIRSPFRRKAAEFRPDSVGSGWSNKFHITHVQRDTLLKWGGYTALLVLLCMLQDVIMSKIHFFGSTTDLVVSGLLLITVMEGVSNGSVFILLGSLLYYFSGSSPTPWGIILLCYLGIGASIFRQMYLHRGLMAITFCAGVALMIYEIGTYGIGLFLGLTHWGRIFQFLITGGLSWAVMLALYPLVNKIGLIGGNIWKE